MPLPLVPIGVVTLIGTVFMVQRNRTAKGEVSEQIKANRAAVYDVCINQCKDTKKLRVMAEAFRSEGLTAEADMITQRIALAEASPEQKNARRELLQKALSSTKPEGVREAAVYFDSIGATGAAKRLNEYADGLLNASTAEVTPNDEV